MRLLKLERLYVQRVPRLGVGDDISTYVFTTYRRTAHSRSFVLIVWCTLCWGTWLTWRVALNRFKSQESNANEVPEPERMCVEGCGFWDWVSFKPVEVILFLMKQWFAMWKAREMSKGKGEWMMLMVDLDRFKCPNDQLIRRSNTRG